MPDRQPSLRKTHITTERPPFERIALVLQGGGALGAYQGGVYQALAEANLHPDWVAGISIGAINSALIAGNPPEKRVERLREFWETVSSSPIGIPGGVVTYSVNGTQKIAVAKGLTEILWPTEITTAKVSILGLE
jgi:NTE family protein